MKMKLPSGTFYFYPIYHSFYVIIFIYLLFIVSKVSCYEKKKLSLTNIQNNLILPGILLKNQSLIENPGFYKISVNTLKENQWYKIMAHYPSSVKIFFEYH
jgi:hypothetical protein